MSANELGERNVSLLYLISKFEKGLVGRTRLQKMVYLSNKEGGVSIFNYPFRPYLYGPYSGIIFSDINALITEGFLTEDRTQIVDSIGHETYQYTYKLTEKGKNKLRELGTISQQQGIDKVFSSYGGMSLSEILKYVYSKYL
jgi:uncharacterized protein YwgA